MRLTCLLVTAVVLLASVGCSTTRTTDTSRTGLEQLLISNAVDQTLSKMAMPPVRGRKVFLETQYLDCVDKGYLVASLRHRLLSEGAMMVDAKEDSEMTVEIRSGALGTDNRDSYVGIPKLSVPGILPIELPEVRVWENKSQFGTAKVGMVAYNTSDGALVFDSGKPLARADDSRWSIMGVGPFHSGTVPDEVEMGTSHTSIAKGPSSFNESVQR